MTNKRAERREYLLALLDGEPLVGLVAVKQRFGVEGNIRKSRVSQDALIGLYLRGNIVGLVMEYKR